VQTAAAWSRSPYRIEIEHGPWARRNAGQAAAQDQQREAIRRRDVDGETLRSIARSYNVSPQTISRL
jgi:hypothetical protein